jgi:hypothetical protein
LATNEMDNFYPSLYNEANNASVSGQVYFLRFVKAEYILLLVASLAMLPVSTDSKYLLLVAFAFIALITVTLWKAFSGPDRNWYNGRAVAESVKTLTWRYSMKAAPFNTTVGSKTPATRFSEELDALLKTNKDLGKGLSAHTNTGEQITNEMNSLRGLPFKDRLKFYLKNRVDEQRHWYSKKAKYNSDSYKHWIKLILFLYAIGVILVLLRAIWPHFEYWPIDSVVVWASCALGWLQLKKFNELSEAYGLTANEIGLIKVRSAEIRTELQFFEFVKDAEMAFSREHTQWIVRQSS